MNNQQAVALELDRHHLQLHTVRVVAEKDNSRRGVSMVLLAEAKATVFNDKA